MEFSMLSHDGQVALAAWAVLLAAEPLVEGEVIGLPPIYNRAVGAIASTVGLRTRKRHNNTRRYDRKRVRP